MSQQDANLREAARLAQETMDKCDAYIGESSDDSCRSIYARIKELMREQKQLLEQELEAHAGNLEQSEAE
mgnify:CR=1 FL=1